MPTPNERKALGFLVLIALSGGAVRVWRAGMPPPPAASAAALERQIQRADSAAASAKARPRTGRQARARPDASAGPPVRVDLDRATAEQIEALPGIGPALASRIIAFRDSVGSFGSMDAVCAVRGVGPALARRLSPLVTFSAPRRPVSATCGEGSKSSRSTRGPRGREQR